jgi:hypothetical protein
MLGQRPFGCCVIGTTFADAQQRARHIFVFCQGVVWRPTEFLLAFVANCTTIGQIMVDVARV